MTFRFVAPAPGLPPGDLDDQLRTALARHSRPVARGLRRGQRDRDHRLRTVRHHRREARHRAHARGPRGLRLGTAVVRAPGTRLPRRHPPDRDARGQCPHRIAPVRTGGLHPVRPGLRRSARRLRRLRALRPADARGQQRTEPALHEPAAERHPRAPGARRGRRRAGGRRHDLHRELPGRDVRPELVGHRLQGRVRVLRLRPREVGVAAR